MPNEEVVVIIRGPHDSGRSTLARIIEAALLENGYLAVEVEDTVPLPKEQKAPLVDRWSRNRETRKHRIKVETEGERTPPRTWPCCGTLLSGDHRPGCKEAK